MEYAIVLVGEICIVPIWSLSHGSVVKACGVMMELADDPAIKYFLSGDAI